MTTPHDSLRTFQAQFHQRWNHLNDPHVRALTWLLYSPDLLDPLAPQWQGNIATLADQLGCDIEAWLTALDQAPQALHAYLNLSPFMRLGRYAERLLAFYFHEQSRLAVHGLQVRAGKGETIGEFDFLLHDGQALQHWEFAAKFYLLEHTGAGQAADYFVGPNLADTLDAKIRKLMDRQLALARHPAAQACLPQPVSIAKALIKGWLFYRDDPQDARRFGVSSAHCRGFWCTARELRDREAERYVILPRLLWLAPAKATEQQSIDLPTLLALLDARFRQESMPAMVALLEVRGESALEIERGFVVPDDWQARAVERVRQTGIC